MPFNYRITLFTPTYNRAYILDNLYHSIQRQTFRDFEWIIIDDGSSDHTEELVNRWISEGNDFPIRYFKVSNGGKCRAINKALDYAEGELFFVMDSDDYLTDDALEKVDLWFKHLDPNSKIKGIVANRGYSEEKTSNYLFSEPYLDKSLLDIYTFSRDSHRVFDGERAFIFYTDFHRQYRYPEFEGENFMGEAVVWNRMANDGYTMRFYNDIIWVFEYKEDGLTKAGSSIFLKNPQGYGLLLQEKAKFLGWSNVEVLQMWHTFTCDLSQLYSCKQISEYIGAPYFLIHALNTIHTFSHMIKNILKRLKKLTN